MQLIRCLLVIIIWLSAKISGSLSTFYLVTIFRSDGPVPVLVSFGRGTRVFCLFILVGYIFQRMVNYIIGLPPKPVEAK